VLVRFAGTENQTQRPFFSRLTVVLFEPTEIEFHLAFVGSPEPAQLEIHGEEAAQASMEEKQIEVVVVVVRP